VSWEQLSEIYQQAEQNRKLEESSPPVRCPRCSTLLTTGPQGRPHCTFCGWGRVATLSA
jgi:hypothetical protein